MLVNIRQPCFLRFCHYDDRCVVYRCKGLKILETFTTLTGDDLQLPSFLEISHEVTGDPTYSMFYLSSKDPDVGVPSHVLSKPAKPIMTNGISEDGVTYHGDA